MTVGVSARFHVDAKDLGKWAAPLGKRINTVVRAGLRKGGRAALPVLRDATARYPIKAFGHFMRGWRAETEGNQLTLLNIVPYSIFVEKGRRPGARQPPVMALIPWVRAILGAPAKRERSVAFLVARAISRRGIAPRPVLTSPMTRRHAMTVARNELIAELDKALREELKKASRRG
jgi:hypothetical protein